MNPLLVCLSRLVAKGTAGKATASFALAAVPARYLREVSRAVRSGRLALASMVMMAASAIAPAHASIEAMNDFSAMDSSRFRWLETQAVKWQGVPAYWREFTSHAPVLQAAQSIAQYADRFQRVIAFKDTVLLSGVRADWHWVAQIQSASGGSRGRVSILSVSRQELEAAAQSRGDSHFPWLALNARLDFSQDSMVEGRRITQQVYGAQLPVEQITAYVQQNLRSSGWRIEPQLASSAGPDVWRRNKSHLFVFAMSLGQGSAIFLNHVE